MKTPKRSEEGQALVLIVLGIIVMLGFAALAIDGGRVYTDRRTMQNASDTASLAGAAEYAHYFAANSIFYSNFDSDDDGDCTDESWYAPAKTSSEAVAITRAASNSYTIDNTLNPGGGDNNGLAMTCGADTYGTVEDYYIDVQTMITADTPSSFAQFVFSGPLRQTVESIARIYPQTSLALGHAVVALNTASCQGNQNGLLMNGTNNITINGGGMWSNGCFSAGGSSGSIAVTGGSNNYVGQYSNSGGYSISPAPVQSSETMPSSFYSVDPPDCSGLPSNGAHSGGGTISEGSYTEIDVGNDDLVMNAGLYCVTGDVSVGAQGTISGAGITIYMNGDFSVQAGSEVIISAPTGNVSPELSGVLIYNYQVDYGNTACVDLTGNSTSYYAGTVYAPDCKIDIGGNSGALQTYHTQLIGYNVEFHGNVTLDINFQDNAVYQLPPRLNLQK